MRKVYLSKILFPVCAGLISVFLAQPVAGQQYIVMNKDVTRTDQPLNKNLPVLFSSLTATRHDGYNEISWATVAETNTRKFVVEYSMDGINFQTASELIPSGSSYAVKQYTTDMRPVLYRVKVIDPGGRSYYSKSIMLQGTEISPVKVYPTIVTGNMINVEANWPVQRITIVCTDGAVLYEKEISGQTNLIRVNTPSLSKGIYWVNFFGDGWKSSSKFLVP